jgi:YVTN family beta-propeller protein
MMPNPHSSLPLTNSTGTNKRRSAARCFALIAAALLLLGPARLTARADTLVATIPVGSNPISAAITPDGSRVFVANNNSSSVSVIDTFSNTVVNTISTGTPCSGVAVSPDGTQLWVALSGSNSVAVYDTWTLTLVPFAQNPIPVGSFPFNIAFKGGGGQAFVTNFFSNTVSVIKTNTGSVINTLNVGTNPIGIAVAFNPTSGVNTVFVANSGSNNISYFNPSSPVVSFIGAGSAPYGVASSSDGTQVYVTNSNSNNMTRLDVSASGTLTGTSTISTGTTPRGVRVRSTGTSGLFRAYVANNANNNVWKIKPNGVLLETISVGSSPVGIAALPFGNLVYVTNAASNTVSVISAN